MAKQTTKDKDIHRLIDANINRLKEGLRVLEDITRFVLDDKKLTAGFKQIRHGLKDCFFETTFLIKERKIESDVGKKSISPELERKNALDIFLANSQRVKESLRVLEEFAKLFDKKAAANFKNTRYKIYYQEQKAAQKLMSLLRRRETP